MHVLLSRWAPPAERGVLSAVVYAGTALGTVLSMLLAGVLSANLGKNSIHTLKYLFSTYYVFSDAVTNKITLTGTIISLHVYTLQSQNMSKFKHSAGAYLPAYFEIQI